MRICFMILFSIIIFSCNQRVAAEKTVSDSSQNHAKLSTPIVKKWQAIKINRSVSQLSSLINSTTWYQNALIQPIKFQTGKWHVWIEEGYSVYRIYPFLKKDEDVPFYQGIVIKLNKPHIDLSEFINAISDSNSPIKISEYATFGNGLGKYVPKSR